MWTCSLKPRLDLFPSSKQNLEEISQALEATELIKVKFNDFKEKDQKNSMINEIAKATKSHIAGMIGHVAILYRQNQNPEKQQIRLP